LLKGNGCHHRDNRRQLILSLFNEPCRSFAPIAINERHCSRLPFTYTLKYILECNATAFVTSYRDTSIVILATIQINAKIL